MHLFCPACQATFLGASHCPRCDVALVPVADAPAETGAVDDPTAPPAPVTPTVAGRVVFGTLVGLGLYLGLRRFLSAGLILTAPDPGWWWDALPGLVTAFALQAVAVLVGGALAGAARPRGLFTGTTVGLIVGGLLLGADLVDGGSPDRLVLYVQPALLALLGGAAGAAGARVWPAVPRVVGPLPRTKTLSSMRLLLGGGPKEAERPTVWWRVLFGALVMASGVVLADNARVVVQKASAGVLKVESVGQGRFVSWQLAALAAAAGAVFAAAGTGAGMRHGVYAGLLAGTGASAILASQGGELPPQVAYVMEQVASASGSFEGASGVVILWSVAAVGLVGGWVGGQLFPPLAPSHMRHRLRLMA